MATKAVISAVSCRSSGRATAGGQHGWYIWMPRLPRGVGAYGPRPSIQRTLHTSPPRLNGHGEALALSSRRPNCPASLAHADRLEHMPRPIPPGAADAFHISFSSDQRFRVERIAS